MQDFQICLWSVTTERFRLYIKRNDLLVFAAKLTARYIMKCCVASVYILSLIKQTTRAGLYQPHSTHLVWFYNIWEHFSRVCHTVFLIKWKKRQRTPSSLKVHILITSVHKTLKYSCIYSECFLPSSSIWSQPIVLYNHSISSYLTYLSQQYIEYCVHQCLSTLYCVH